MFNYYRQRNEDIIHLLEKCFEKTIKIQKFRVNKENNCIKFLTPTCVTAIHKVEIITDE